MNRTCFVKKEKLPYVERISHIGSTAIKGIWAKPIIDIIYKNIENTLEWNHPRANRVGGKRKLSSYFRFPTSHTTVRAVRHTAVPILDTIRDNYPSA